MIVKKVIFFIAFFIISNFASIITTENTTRRLSFVFQMEKFSLSTFQNKDSIFSWISFSDANTKLVGNGNILLPSISLYAGVPYEKKMSVRFVSLEVKRISLEHPLPAYNDENDLANYAHASFENPWVSKVSYVHLRAMRTGHFFIKPFLYDPKTRVLTILLKGSCIIDFPVASTNPVSFRGYKNDYYEMLRGLLLNYDIAVRWMQIKKRPLAKSLAKPILPAKDKMLRFTIGDGIDGVKETLTDENGIVKIKGSDIEFLSDSPVKINTVSLFASIRKELDSIVPLVDEIPDGVVEIPLMRVDSNGNDILDADDYLLAYVTGICDWYYDTTKKDFAYTFNRFEAYRHYWLRIGSDGKTINSFICKETPSDTITVFTNRARYKNSEELQRNFKGEEQKGGIDWVWRKLYRNKTEFSYTLDIQDIITNNIGYIRIWPGIQSGSYLLKTSFGDSLLTNYYCSDWLEVTDWSKPILSLEFIPTATTDFFELKMFDIKYQQHLDMNGKKSMRIYSPIDSGIVLYKLSNMPLERTVIFRISPDESSVSLVADTTFGNYEDRSYTWVDTAGKGIQYFVCVFSAFIEIPQVYNYLGAVNSGYEVKDLKNITNKADYLIITHTNFISEANRLAEHKKSTGKFDFPKVVDTEDIFREFSGGNHGPAAIRNFMLYIANFWTPVHIDDDPAPDYVLLFGNGHYDAKGYSTNEINYIPTAQFYDSGIEKCIDDFFSCITPGEHVVSILVTPDIILGRIPCISLVEARNVVDKIIETEGQDADYGAWRNRLLLVSDDDIQGPNIDYIPHYKSNEEIGDSVIQIRPSLEIRKVYLFEYEPNELYEKPEASSALFNEVNNGVVCVNYFGHGSQDAWADERIMEKDKLSNFNNKGHYPIVSSYSCSVAYFDKPDHSSISDKLVVSASSGSIASIASTRMAFANKNTEMAKTFYNLFFEKNASRTVGQAFTQTKASDNLKHYVLLGDPSIRFVAITDSVEMDILSTDDLLIDTLKALQAVKIRGKIVKIGSKSVNASFGVDTNSAYVRIGLFNPISEDVTRKDGIKDKERAVSYSLPGTPVFVGLIEVKNGRFEHQLLLPMRVSMDKPGVKLTAYAWGGKQFATGCRDDIIFSGTDTTNISNKEGPRITVRPVYDTTTWNSQVGFTDKITSVLPLECEINVWDENGIDVTGTGPDEGLTIEINGKRENVNNKFVFLEGGYTKGRTSIVIEEGKMYAGTYDLHIRAQDLLGNISKLTVSLEILSENDFKLGHVFNYPNPVRMGNTTRFYFFHSNSSQERYGNVDAEIRIFTLSGKLIRIFKNARNGQEWNCTDQRGHVLGPNVYLYRVIVTIPDFIYSNEKKRIKSPVKKLVIHPPG